MEELIIASVYKREALWNPSHSLHKNVGVLKKLWQKVANEVNTDEKNVKTKWKNMRAYFLKELKKMQHPKSGDSADNIVTSQWAFFEPLLFLKTTVSASSRDSNLSTSNPISSPEPPFTEDESFTSRDSPDIQENLTSSDYIATSLAETSYSSNASQKRRKICNLLEQNNQTLALDKRQSAILEKDRSEPNSDMLFFESLVPYMADIPMIQKLRLRSKIQELILAELEIASGIQ